MFSSTNKFISSTELWRVTRLGSHQWLSLFLLNINHVGHHLAWTQSKFFYALMTQLFSLNWNKTQYCDRDFGESHNTDSSLRCFLCVGSVVPDLGSHTFKTTTIFSTGVYNPNVFFVCQVQFLPLLLYLNFFVACRRGLALSMTFSNTPRHESNFDLSPLLASIMYLAKLAFWFGCSITRTTCLAV